MSSAIKTKHVLRFCSDFDDRGLNTENADGKYRLFEIDGGLGEALLGSSEQIFIKGGSMDEAVMCTKTETFEIRKKESSNTVLLVPETFETQNVFPAPQTPTNKNNLNKANAPLPSEENSTDKQSLRTPSRSRGITSRTCFRRQARRS